MSEAPGPMTAEEFLVPRESDQASSPRVDGPANDRPNVLLIVLDDVGFAHLGCFGSEIDTPALDRLAENGLRYTNFHATPICSPSRASILTGRNPHSIGVGAITDWGNGRANTAGLSLNAATIAEILREDGYRTCAIGKWHVDSPRHASAAGPFHNWPLGRGFDRFYGFLGGCTDYYHPDLIEDNHPIYRDLASNKDNYHLTVDLADQAIRYLTDVRSASPDRQPFLLYYALGAAHAPLQAPSEFIDRYSGKFDRGWDELRKETFQRQLEMGIIPEGTDLPPRMDEVPAWDSLPIEQQKLYARMQEVFAGFLTHADRQIGRVIEFIESTGELDNTIVMAISDNGASIEGWAHGTDNHLRQMNGIFDEPSDLADRVHLLGTEFAMAHYPQGWSMVGNTPNRLWKRFAHGGGIRVPMIVRYPKEIADPGGVRTQFHFVTDVVPTVLDILDVKIPETLLGRPQIPVHGVSMRPTFGDRDAPQERRIQYFEVLGNRALWFDGWKIVCRRSPGIDVQHDQWELYHVAEDFSEANDVALDRPELLRAMIDLWWNEAGKYGVLPIDERNWEGRPLSQLNPTRELRMHQGCASVGTRVAPHIIDCSYEISARISRQDSETSGVLVAIGGRFLGAALYVKDNRLVFDYNAFGQHNFVRSSSELPVGTIDVSYRFLRSGELTGLGTLVVNGKEVGAAELSSTAPRHMGLEPVDCGRDTQTPVSTEYESPFEFTGSIHEAVIRLVDDDDSGATAGVD